MEPDPLTVPAPAPLTPELVVAQVETPKPSGNPFERNLRRNKLIRLGALVGGGIAVLVIGFGILNYFTNSGILILQPDKSFTVSLNGTQAALSEQKDGVYIHTSPGLYRLTLSKTGFEPFLTDLRVNRGQTIKIRPVFAILPKTTDLSNTTVDYVRPSRDGKYVYYLGNSRQTIYRVEIGSESQIPITGEPLKDVRDIQWSDQPDLALIVQGDGTYLQEIPRYDFIHQDKIKIAGKEISSPVWDPNDPNRLAFAYHPGTGENTLVFSDKHLQALDHKVDISAITNPQLIWSSNSDYILLLDRSLDTSKQNLWIFHTVDSSLRQLTTGGNVADASFAPDSGTILYGMVNTPDLHAITLDGTTDNDLHIQATVAQSAWKDDHSFYVPDVTHNLLALYQVSGPRTDLPFSFPSSAIQGMSYFPSSQTLTFYTASTIYLADLSK